MRFACKRVLSSVFQGRHTVRFIPAVDGVRLLTTGHRFARWAGQERLWPALFDTGGVISIVPRAFIEELNCPPSGKTNPFRAFDGRLESFPWYYVLVGLPDLPLFKARVIAPVDPDPAQPRRHISLGCDILSRLRLRCDSTLPWDIDAVPPAGSAWTWEYER